MNQKLFYQWNGEMKKHFGELKKWQTIGFTLIVYGILKARKSQASLIAEELPEFGKTSTVERRIQRWLKNPRIKKEQLRRNWIRWIIESCPSKRIYLLVDETKISDRIGCMMVSVALEKRAIPLVWRCYQANSKTAYPKEGQVGMIVNMLEEIVKNTPENKQIIVEADRGIGHSSKLMKKVKEIGVDFLFRIQIESNFKPKDTNERAPLAEFAQYSQEWSEKGTLFVREDRQVQCTVHIIWDEGQSEPWCLATSVKEITGRRYAMRVWQEESFRDMKSGGWQWQNSLIRNPEIMDRLLFPMAIAYTWCISIGLGFLKMENKERLKIDCVRNPPKYCVFRMGIRAFKCYLFCCSDDLLLHFGTFHTPF